MQCFGGKMKFEKKIIIGSIMSFIATILGVLSIFYPNLLNFQKKKVKVFNASICTVEGVKKLSNFLYERKEDNEIFKLELEINLEAYIADYEDPFEDIVIPKPLFLIKDNSMKLLEDEVFFGLEHSKIIEKQECINKDFQCPDFIGSTTFFIPKNDNNIFFSNINVFDKSTIYYDKKDFDYKEECESIFDKDYAVVFFDGFYLYKRTEVSSFIHLQEIVFEEIAGKDIKLKDY